MVVLVQQNSQQIWMRVRRCQVFLLYEGRGEQLRMIYIVLNMFDNTWYVTSVIFFSAGYVFTPMSPPVLPTLPPDASSAYYTGLCACLFCPRMPQGQRVIRFSS